MTDPTTPLTVTGVVATVMALIFAAAAFYVQRQKRLGGNYADDADDADDDFTPMSQPIPPTPVTPQPPTPTQPGNVPLPEEPAEEPIPPEPPKPQSLFKRYTPERGQESVLPVGGDEECTWE